MILVVCVLGFDCGLMFGFDSVGVDVVFFVGMVVKFNFLINIGYGDVSCDLFLCSLWLLFDEVCMIV